MRTAPKCDRCPATQTIRTAWNIEGVINGAFSSIKRLFPQINYGQDQKPPVTKRTTLIREVIALNRLTPDALVFRRAAARTCGATIAKESWAVIAQFPLHQIGSTSRSAFLVVLTTHGWKLYASILDHR